jgi:uncharacterized alkaline shock family protein YloU
MRHDAGTVTVSPRAMAQIVLQAAESVPGARARRPRRGLDMAIEGERIRITLELAAAYGEVLPELARRVQEEVAAAVSRMCGLAVDAIDVSVEELDL